jgi:hypothetical protein
MARADSPSMGTTLFSAEVGVGGNSRTIPKFDTQCDLAPDGFDHRVWEIDAMLPPSPAFAVHLARIVKPTGMFDTSMESNALGATQKQNRATNQIGSSPMDVHVVVDLRRGLLRGPSVQWPPSDRGAGGGTPTTLALLKSQMLAPFRAAVSEISRLGLRNLGRDGPP